MAIALCVALTSTGVIAMYQVMGLNGGLYPRNQMEQVELSRLLLEIEKDFDNASRVYVWNSWMQEKVGGNWQDLKNNTHSVAIYSTGSDHNLWDLVVGPTDDGTSTSDPSGFLYYWTNNGTSTTIRAKASDSNDKYYTLVFLSGKSAINAVVYLKLVQNSSGVTYTLTRYESDGTQLTAGQTFGYNAPGAGFTSYSDQSDSALGGWDYTKFPYIQRKVVAAVPQNQIQIYFPTAFSKALRDVGTGNTARRVKKSTSDTDFGSDASWRWTFAPANSGRWN